MKLLLDENLEAAILRGLLRRSPGLDVVRVVDVGLAGAPDPAVLAWAAEQGRVVVSRDRATMSLEAARRIEAGEPMPGLLLIRRGASVGVDPGVCSGGRARGGHRIHPLLRREKSTRGVASATPSLFLKGGKYARSCYKVRPFSHPNQTPYR